MSPSAIDAASKQNGTATSNLEEHILAVLPFPEATEFFDKIRRRYPKTKITYYQPHATDVKSVEQYWRKDVEVPPELYKEATILLTLKTLPKPEQAKNLKLVHFFSAGIDHVVHEPLFTSSSVTMTTSSGIHTPQIAEHIFLTLLSLTHHMPQLLTWQRAHHWGSHASSGGYFGTIHDLASKTLGILGYGAIGRHAGRVGKALGMKVLAFTASPKLTPESRRDDGYVVPGTGDIDGSIPDAWFSGLDPVSRREFLAQGIDVLIVAVPLTRETRYFLGHEELEILARPRPGTVKGAYVVNVARGPIIDHEALVYWLKNGLAGAALDVTDPEPLLEDSELWDLPNVVITPHVSGVGSEYKERCLEVFEMNLGRMDKGEKWVNEVSRAKGY